MERAVRPWLHLDCLFNLSSLGKENQRCTQILHDFTNQVGSIVLYFSLSVSMNYQWIGPVQVIRDRKSALGDAEIALDRQTDSVDHEAPKSTS